MTRIPSLATAVLLSVALHAAVVHAVHVQWPTPAPVRSPHDLIVEEYTAVSYGDPDGLWRLASPQLRARTRADAEDAIGALSGAWIVPPMAPDQAAPSVLHGQLATALAPPSTLALRQVEPIGPRRSRVHFRVDGAAVTQMLRRVSGSWRIDGPIIPTATEPAPVATHEE